MIHELKHSPNTMVGFRLSGEVTGKQFDETVVPAVYELILRTDVLNILFVIDESVSDFRFGRWLENDMVLTRNESKWNRIAIVSQLRIDTIIERIFPRMIAVEAERFMPENFGEAVQWVSGQHLSSSEAVFQQENDGHD